MTDEQGQTVSGLETDKRNGWPVRIAILARRDQGGIYDFEYVLPEHVDYETPEDIRTYVLEAALEQPTLLATPPEGAVITAPPRTGRGGRKETGRPIEQEGGE